MIVEIQGMLVEALEKKSGVSQSGNPWCVQEFVIKKNDEKIVFEVFGEDNITSILKQMNTPIRVRCAINCREWNGRYFTSLRYMPPQQQQNTYTQTHTQQAQATNVVEQDNNSSDFPF